METQERGGDLLNIPPLGFHNIQAAFRQVND
jgi:hypothetical protein